MISKQIVKGENYNVSVSEAAGVVKLSASANLDVGGGKVAGVLKLRSTNEIDLSALVLIDLGFDLLAAKLPSLSVEIGALKAIADEQIAKL